MNKKYFFFVLIFILSTVLVAASPAMAARPDNECQPGADNHVIGPWEMMTVYDYADALIAEFGLFPEKTYEETYKIALARAQETYAFCDHNGDGKACVMLQTFPVTVFLVVDNHPYGGK